MTTSALERSVNGAEPRGSGTFVAFRGDRPVLYEEQMSGKPHLSRARTAFEYFHIPDDDEEHRLLGYGKRKREMMVRPDRGRPG